MILLASLWLGLLALTWRCVGFVTSDFTTANNNDYGHQLLTFDCFALRCYVVDERGDRVFLEGANTF